MCVCELATVCQPSENKISKGYSQNRLTSVCLHVFIEVLFHVEVLSAPLAHELLVSNVDAHVGTQLIFVLEALTAVLKRHATSR